MERQKRSGLPGIEDHQLYPTAQETRSSKVAVEPDTASLANEGPSATARELPSNQAMNEDWSAPGNLC